MRNPSRIAGGRVIQSFICSYGSLSARFLCCLCPFRDRHSSSLDRVCKIFSFWFPGPFSPSLCPFGSGSGNSSLAHTFWKCLCKSNILELSCHLFPGESLTDSIPAIWFLEDLTLIYRPTSRACVHYPHSMPTVNINGLKFYPAGCSQRK